MPVEGKKNKFGHFKTILLICMILVATVASVPTSVLVQDSELASNANTNKPNTNNKNSKTTDKRFSIDGRQKVASKGFEKKSNPEVLPASFSNSVKPVLMNELQAGTSRGISTTKDDQTYISAALPILNKRGVNSQPLIYGDAFANSENANYYNNLYSGVMPSNNEIVGDMDPNIAYGSGNLQELSEYAIAPRVSSPYRNRAYENLQNLLNSETYPIYNNRYFGAIDEPKSIYGNNNFNKYNDMRFKRDSKLTPADLLALVAIVEAGERAHSDDVGYSSMPDDSLYYNPRNYYQADTDPDFNRPINDYYGYQLNGEQIFPMTKDLRYGDLNGNRLMAKKKRSLGNFSNEPSKKPNVSYKLNGEKYF